MYLVKFFKVLFALENIYKKLKYTNARLYTNVCNDHTSVCGCMQMPLSFLYRLHINKNMKQKPTVKHQDRLGQVVCGVGELCENVKVQCTQVSGCLSGEVAC